MEEGHSTPENNINSPIEPPVALLCWLECTQTSSCQCYTSFAMEFKLSHCGTRGPCDECNDAKPCIYLLEREHKQDKHKHPVLPAHTYSYHHRLSHRPTSRTSRQMYHVISISQGLHDDATKRYQLGPTSSPNHYTLRHDLTRKKLNFYFTCYCIVRRINNQPARSDGALNRRRQTEKGRGATHNPSSPPQAMPRVAFI